MLVRLSTLILFLTSSTIFASGTDLQAYFDYKISESGSLSVEVKQLRAIAADISARTLNGSRDEVEENISAFPALVAEAYSAQDQTDPKVALKFMILDEELRSHINLYNEGLRKKNMKWRVGAAFGSGALGALVGGIIYKRLNGPDWAGLLAVIYGGAAFAAITATGALTSDVIIRRMKIFRSLDQADLHLIGLSNESFLTNFENAPTKTEIEAYLAGSTSLEDIERKIFPSDWNMRNFIKTWSGVVSEMETYIRSLDDQQKLLALSRALALQGLASEEIRQYNLSQEDIRYTRRWIGGFGGASVGVLTAATAFRHSGNTKFMTGLAILGISGAAIGYYSFPAVAGVLDGDPNHVEAEDFSILEMDLIFE